MLLEIPAVLSAQQLGLVKQLLDKGTFLDGKLSAGMAAKQVKNNEELANDTPEMGQLNNIVMGNLVKHPVYQSAVLPIKIASPFYARYTPGMTYGDHVDDPVMGPPQGRYRSDVSTTVFLNNLPKRLQRDSTLEMKMKLHLRNLSKRLWLHILGQA